MEFFRRRPMAAAAVITLATLTALISASCAYINHRIGQYLQAAPRSVGGAEITVALAERSWFLGRGQFSLTLLSKLSATGSLTYRSTPLLVLFGLEIPWHDGDDSGTSRHWPVYGTGDAQFIPAGPWVNNTYAPTDPSSIFTAQIIAAGNNAHIYATAPPGHVSLPLLRLPIRGINARLRTPLFGSAPNAIAGRIHLDSGPLNFSGNITRQSGNIRLTAPRPVAEHIAKALIIEQQRKRGKPLTDKFISDLATARVRALQQLGYVTMERENITTTIAWSNESITILNSPLPTSLGVAVGR